MKLAIEKSMMLMQAFTIEQYRDSGCFQFEKPELAHGLHQYTHGRMCNGCPKYEGGKCESLRKMLRPAVGQPAGETVRQEATRRGLSISEIRRQRAER